MVSSRSVRYWKIEHSGMTTKPMSDINPVVGTKTPDMVCKFCVHGKHWHRAEGPCRIDECDCEAWDYGTNIADIEPELNIWED